MHSDPDACIVASGLSKRYGADDLAVDSLDLAVRRGEVFCLLGAARSGKTTTLGMVVSLIRPTAGQVLVMGCDPTVDPIGVKRAVTCVTERGALYSSMTARENLEFFAAVGRPQRRSTRSDYDNAMRRVGLPERVFEQPVQGLPREFAVCLWLAVAIARDTPLVVLDEPTKGLDAQAIATVQEALSVLRRQGRAILLATADVFFASRVADRVAIVKNGRKVAERSGAQMLGLSVSELSIDYIGHGNVLLASDLASSAGR